MMSVDFFAIYNHVIMKRMCPPGYHYYGFVATHALGLHIAGTNNKPKSAEQVKQGA